MIQALMSVLHYNNEVTVVLFAESIMGAIWLMFNFLLIHFVVMSVGLLFVQSEMSREGN